MTFADSRASQIALRLAHAVGRERAHKVVDIALASFTATELAALAARWEFWARPNQLSPLSRWRTWGFLTGRGWGKTLSISEHVNQEVEAGRAMLIGLAAQDEANSIALQVQGPSGLIATAPPWFKPRWEASALQLVWPNGARAYVRTPEVPGKIRGLEYHLSWICELQSWPAATREEAFSNFFLSTRLGYARIVWDSTPKRRNPMLLELLAENERDPIENVIVRGSMRENLANLGDGYVQTIERKYGGTQKGKEEIDGEMLEDNEGALFKQEWIDDRRAEMPSNVLRSAIAIDVAVTTRAGSDRSGIVAGLLGADDRLYMRADFSGKHSPEAWAKIVLDECVAGRCDLVIVETNKGGDLVTRNLRAAASERKLRVIVVDKKWVPRRDREVVYVREVFSKGAKEDRAQPLATAYERGRASHVRGADLGSLETTFTTWVPMPGARSPDDLDAAVLLGVELLGLDLNEADPKTGFKGIEKMHAALEASASRSDRSSLSSSVLNALTGRGRGDSGGGL